MHKLNEWIKIDENPQSGVSTWILDDGEEVTVQTRQDMGALLDQNRAERNMKADGWQGDWHSVARIPLAMLHDTAMGDALRAGDDKWINGKLNDSEFANLRTKEGKL